LLLLAVRRLGLFLQVGQALVLEATPEALVAALVVQVALVAQAHKTVTELEVINTFLVVAAVVAVLLAAEVVLAALVVAGQVGLETQARKAFQPQLEHQVVPIVAAAVAAAV